MMTSLATRLIEARTDKGWTKADLKRAAKLKSPSTLTELESGKRTESPQLPMIAAALGVSALWLQHGIGEKHPKHIAPNVDMQLPGDVLTISPKTERDGWMNELTSLAGQLDALRLGMLIKTARDLLAEIPAKQTPVSSR